jgi:hypothetical protein
MKQLLRRVSFVFWEYAVEILLAGLISALAIKLLELSAIRSALHEYREELSLSLLAVFGASAAIWAAFLAVLGTDFGKKLRMHGQATAYSVGLAFPMFTSIVASLVVPLHTTQSTGFRTAIALYMLTYASITFLNLVRNVIGLIRLWQEWERLGAR